MKNPKGDVEHPKTELEYWCALESITYEMWVVNQGVLHGELKADEAYSRGMERANNILRQMTNEIYVLFGVIPHAIGREVKKLNPNAEAPPGMTWCDDWYKKMRAENLRLLYEQMICSACPFSGGLGKFSWNSGKNYPCQAPGDLDAGVLDPQKCGMVAWKRWGSQYFHEAVLEKAGEDALEKVKSKEAELQCESVKL